jgi:hypothetical protein
MKTEFKNIDLLELFYTWKNIDISLYELSKKYNINKFDLVVLINEGRKLANQNK